MTDIVSPLLQWLNSHPELSGLFTFLISACESVAIIGTIVPGSIMMTAIGALAGAGVIPLWPTLIWAILGAIVGDGVSYWIGRYFTTSLHRMWPFRTHPKLLQTGEKFVAKYGSMSVFIGRFVGPVRALVPLVAGMLGMRPLKFTLANVTSAIGWAPAYMLPGILLGAAALELPPDIAMHFILTLLLLGLFTLLCLWFIYKLIQLIQNHLMQIQIAIWERLTRSPYLSTVTKLLKHHDGTRQAGQLNLAFYFIICFSLFSLLAIYVDIVHAKNILANDTVHHLFRGIRTPLADDIMLKISFLGQKQIILPVVFVISALLIFWKRWRAAFHALALAFLASAGVFIAKNIIKSVRPWGILDSPETFSMPSGHTTLATTLYLGLAFLIANSVKPRFRFLIYSFAIFIALIVGISRLYLGAHWFTDVLSAWFLGGALLLAVMISYQRRKEKSLPINQILLVGIASLCITYAIFYHQHFSEFKLSYSQISLPTKEIALPDWSTRKTLTTYRTSLFGFPSQKINIEWIGDLEKIRGTLLNEGWTKPPSRNLISTIHRITDISSTQYLPLISPQYLDKKPALILTREAQGLESLLVIRLWDANQTIANTHEKVWVGIVGTIPRSYAWLFRKNPEYIELNSNLIFPNKKEFKKFEIKTLVLPQNKKAFQSILMIKSK